MPTDFHADLSTIQGEPIACILGGKVMRLSSDTILILESPCKIEFAGQVRLTTIDETKGLVTDEPLRSDALEAS